MPLAQNSFPNSTHLCTLSTCHCLRCSSPMAFARHLVGQAHMETPSGIAVNDTHDYSEVGSKGDPWRPECCAHLGPLEWSMNLIKSKTPRGLCPHKPLFARRGSPTPLPLAIPPFYILVGGMQQIMTKSLSVRPKTRTEHTYSVLIRIPASTSRNDVHRHH